jgi:SAM-dependent methyltransferase
MEERIIAKVNKYYTEKVLEFGATPKGVDWNGVESQELRFAQLLKVADREVNDDFTLLDYGCGFGSLYDYLLKANRGINYIGFDISKEMLKTAIAQYGNQAVWKSSLEDNFTADYVVASGLFNVKLDQRIADWEKYIVETINFINIISIKGFAFNILTSYSDAEYKKDYLYYASPEYFFKHCKLNYSKQVSLLHDYGLYEFTLIVRK